MTTKPDSTGYRVTSGNPSASPRPFHAPGIPPPSFIEDDMFTAIVPMTATPEAVGKQGSGEADRQAAVHVESQDKANVTPQVTPQVARLLGIVQGEMSRTELMHALGLKDRMNFSDGYLAPALSAGFVERTIPDRPNSRLQKCRLTAKGQAALLFKPDGSTPA